jgi:alanine racemase
VVQLAYDTRTLQSPFDTLFIALKGPVRDGHQFIQAAYEKGVRMFMVSTTAVDLPQDETVQVIQVPNTLQALQTLAAHHRRQFHYPVLAITGSNGKTIVKEWLYSLLSSDTRIVRSPKSFNSQLGVALSLWQFSEHQDLAIIEAGISHRGEMETLAEMIRADIGIFTNIGEAHSEGFESLEEKVREKIKLFRYAKQVLYCSDHPVVRIEMETWLQRNPTVMPITWGAAGKEDNFLEVGSIRKDSQGAEISGSVRGQHFQFRIPFTDHASMENLLHCITYMYWKGYDTAAIQSRLPKVQPVAMRLELKQGIQQSSVINDSYSNDLSSLRIALDFMMQQQQHSKRTVILSDILESGVSATTLYSSVAELLSAYQVDRLIGIGPQISAHEKIFSAILKESCFYRGTQDFLQVFPTLKWDREIILLKGARVFGFEQIDQLLSAQAHQTVLEIHLGKLVHNLRAYRRMLPLGTRIMAMVKAFSYGSGTYEIANRLQHEQVDYLAVAYADEGASLRQAGIRLPIMVMNPEQHSFGTLVQYELEPVLYSVGLLQSFVSYLEQISKPYPVHIELETGMHRLGMESLDLQAVMPILQSGVLRIVSVFSHLVASEDPAEDAFTQQQFDTYQSACAQLKAQGITGFWQHLANTAAMVRHPDWPFDMVRLGIGLYGINSAKTTHMGLEEVSSLRTTIAQIQEVEVGQTVGYNRKGKLNRKSRIATVRIGYADGYSRRFGNGVAYMLVAGQQAPVVGSVCMDMTMIDITDIPEAREGDLVTVFGSGLSISQLAEWAGTIPYEIMTSISGRVKRVYIEET